MESFNSTLVQLKDRRDKCNKIKIISFNSTLVQLKGVLDCLNLLFRHLFQFYLSSIKSQYFVLNLSGFGQVSILP